MPDHFYAVIMAGGGGTRLWPLSRQARPKQMLRLIDEHTLFQTSVQRLIGLFPVENILVVTVQEQVQDLHQQFPELPIENFLIEPMPRGTASVVGLAAVAIQQRDPEAVMAVLTADHHIGNVECFQRVLRVAYAVARDNYLVTLGIEPTFPAIGFGYIQRGESLGTYQDHPVYHVARFKEKPDLPQAKMMVAAGDHYWNSGMFVWKTGNILAEFERQMPGLAKDLMEISRAWNTAERTAVVERLWPTLQAQTIDYGIMENAQKVAVVPAGDFAWNDVGSWDSLFDILECDRNGNIVVGGRHVGLETQTSLVYMNQPHRLIVTIGVKDLIVVDTGDVLLVCSKEKAQDVRKVVEHLRKDDQEYV